MGYPIVGCSRLCSRQLLISLKDGDFHTLSGKSVPVVRHPHSKEIKVPWDGSMTLCPVRHSSQFCVISRVAEDALYPHPGCISSNLSSVHSRNLLDCLCPTTLSIILLCRHFLGFTWACLRRFQVSPVLLVLFPFVLIIPEPLLISPVHNSLPWLLVTVFLPAS